MATTCPNTNLKEWKELSSSRGEDMAYFLWDKYNGNVPQSESKQNIVKSNLKAIDALSLLIRPNPTKRTRKYNEAPGASRMTIRLNTKERPNIETNLRKDLNGRGVSDTQVDMIFNYMKSKGIDEISVQDLIIGLTANNSFTVEVNTTRDDTNVRGAMFESQQLPPTQYYSKLTVPGGTKYTENEISTPDITPNIKGHARFSTDQGIGWFRSDEKESGVYESKNDFPLTIKNTLYRFSNQGNKYIKQSGDAGFFTRVKRVEISEKEFKEASKLYTESKGKKYIDSSKTRRILEVQSDLFQKGRTNSTLIDAIIYNDITDATVNKLLDNRFEVGQKFKVNDSWFEVLDIQGDLYKVQNTNNKREAILTKKALANSINKRNISDSKIPENDFLQLLNQKGNWVNFFIQSIVQDSVKKGYEKVLFPSGETAAKVEGHQTIVERVNNINKNIKFEENELIEKLSKVKVGATFREFDSSIGSYTTIEISNETEAKFFKSTLKSETDKKIKVLEERRDDFKTQGLEKLAPIEAFYTNRVTNILNKLYDVKKITDEYGNTWNEIILDDKIGKNTILLQKKGTEGRTKASPQVIAKTKEVIEKMGVNMQELVDYAKGNTDVDASTVNAIADLSAGVIAIAEGKEDVALVEEMVHIATAIIEQRDPKLITELISKIDRFKIYKDTLAEYRDLKAYQLPNGKPDIRKIKKEAVDKLIAEIIAEGNVEAYTQEEQSLVRRMWNAILDWFRGEYQTANIDIFSKTAERVIGGQFEGNILELSDTEVYYQTTDAQKEFLNKLGETQRTLRNVPVTKKNSNPLLEDEVSNEYEVLINGEWVTNPKRVTNRTEAWYRQKFGDKTFTDQEDKDNEIKRELGTKYHLYFEEMQDRFFNSDGTRRTTPGERPNITDNVDDQVYTKLEKYYTDLIAEYSKDGKNPLVLSEVQVYDKKQKEAGTIDLLIVEEDGTAHIYDWKFMSVAQGAEDVAWFKQGAYGIQLNRYREILLDNYGIKSIGKNRAVPIIMDLQRDNFQDLNSKLKIKGIQIGSVNPKSLESLTLTPVSAPTETTGIKKLDIFIKKLNAIAEQIGAKQAKDDDDRAFKNERLNIIKKAVRSIQGQQNLGPLIDTIEVMMKQGNNLTAKWKTSYEGRPANDKDLANLELSEYSAELREYLASAAVFSEITNYIGDMIYKEGDEVIGGKEQKEFLQNIKNKQQEISELRTDLELISGEFAEKFIGERNLVTGLMNPEKVVKGLASWFRGLSTIGLKATDILYTVANRATNLAERDTISQVNELRGIQDRIKAKGGDIRKTILKLYQKDDKGGLVNKLIYKYKKEFYDSVDRNAEEGARSKKWIADNVDAQAYIKESKAKLKERITRIGQSYPGDELFQLREKLITEEQRKWDITRQDFNGWNNYIIKRHPKEKWLSTEYKEIAKDPDLFALYNFITKVNLKAQDVGYINNKVQSTFLPFIRKSMAESLAWDGPNLKAIKNFTLNLTSRADDVGYGKINTLTGEVEQSIPKYYTRDFTVTENGPNDYSDVSLDLFKNMILYVQHVNKYTYLSEIEDQMLLVKTTQSFKDHLRTNKFNQVIQGEVLAGNDDNVKIIDQFQRKVMYDERYVLDDSDVAYGGPIIKATKNVVNAVGKKLGRKTDIFEEGEPTVGSLTKTMDALNRYVQMKSLGLNPLSGAVNFFGGNLQISALAGKYFDAREVLKNETMLIGNKFRSEDDREMFVQLLDKFMPLKDDPSYETLKEAGMTKLTRANFSDILFVLFRKPEQLLEKAVFSSLLQNMMVVDGRIVNIRDFVRDKYKASYSSGTPAERAAAYKAAKVKISEEIIELKKNRSIDSTKKLEDGKLVIPGLDLNNTEELMRVTNVARSISRSATGGLTEFDDYRATMNIWTKSFMVFKGWIPKLVDTRFGGFRKDADNFNVKVDENGQTTGEKYEIGRIKLFMGVLGLDAMKIIRNINSINKMDENGVIAIDKLYDKYTEEYIKDFGEVPNISKEDFIELVRVNLNRQVKELQILIMMIASMIAFGTLAPDDDEDRATKNLFRYTQKALDKFTSEILFFYNPGEMTGMLDGGLPAIGFFNDVGRVLGHFVKQTTGMDISDPDKTPQEVRDQAQPIKNFIKMLPVGNPLMTLMSTISDEFAREMDITIQKTNR